MSALSVVSVTSNKDIPAGQAAVLYMVDASSDPITITLPDATTYNGDHMIIKRCDTSIETSVTILTRLSQGIDGQTLITLEPYQCHHLACDLHNWYIISTPTNITILPSPKSPGGTAQTAEGGSADDDQKSTVPLIMNNQNSKPTRVAAAATATAAVAADTTVTTKTNSLITFYDSYKIIK
jgi:hypothetical protein